MGVAKVNGKLFSLGRAGYEASTSPHQQHIFFSDWVKLNHHLFDEVLNEGERLAGEWLAQAHGTKYKLIHAPFVAFDLMAGSVRTPYDEFIRRLNGRFVVPHLLHRGDAFSVE